MIRIQKTDIDDIANYWADKLRDFLSYNKLKSYRTFFYKACDEKDYEAVSRITKINTWLWIERFLSKREHLIGDRRFFIKWLGFQNVHIKDHPLKTPLKVTWEKIYNDFSPKIAYDIFHKLGVRTCPYCNRHYTFTLNSETGKFKTRPQFEHFHDKATYPFFAVTFFNLVPSCAECNTGKRNNPCGVNPYFDDFNAKFVITKPMCTDGEEKVAIKMNINEILNISTEEDFNVDFEFPDDQEVKDAEELNVNTLGLRPLYNMHKDYVMEMVEKAAAYDVLTRDGITDRFQGLYHSETEVFNLIFGRYLFDSEQSNRPLSKLTADILDQLQIRLEPPVP